MSQPFGLLAASALALALGIQGVSAADKPIVGLITKTNTNPFFVKMKAGAEEAAKAHGVELRSFAGKVDGDNDGQVAAVENLIASGAKGILITPNDSRAIVPAIEKARAAGILVIALDTPLDPPTAADATFATDNFQAGALIGQWAAKTLGAKAASAKIALLDLNVNQISVDVARDQGFLKGFGIDIGNPARIGDEKDARIVGHDITLGSEEGGRKAMENLLQKDPSVSVVYTINEPAAAGAYEALRSVGRKDVLIISVDGGCPGVRNVKDGVIGATSMQFPLLMAAKGVEAVKKFATDGTKPQTSPGLDFVNTGVELVTDRPVPGLSSIDSAAALKKCWG
ncbi:sugar ABC transporter substrate-binding protein [Bosea sp. (in: a-proteobacteria)]|uniref:sugar ABC transporter substrate-binding protein n=1 Tax=Bosea sp. (in: a-proteobacteria) TaxID=1871050 RepID=UPI0025BADD8E|nr:sugar ABC transporter substrate-binding protein [Bosea sp. (in: a-proteobacteria)]MBR3194551.1 sugar ABC transporter substrate-binding protein [Bosea sp. (in: a-proteobacteria)]